MNRKHKGYIARLLPIYHTIVRKFHPANNSEKLRFSVSNSFYFDLSTGNPEYFP